MPRVSVIIPAHNAEPFLGDALSSVEAQTYADWEVVVSDDGSTDRTIEIAAGFGESVKIVRAEKNAGPATARNRAIAQASGELLALLDADDLWLPEYLEHQVSLFDESQGRYGDVGLVACNARVLGADGFLDGTYADYVGAPAEVTLQRLLKGNFIYVSVLSPRAIIDQAGGFCPEIFGAEDYDLWVRVVELGYRVVLTDQMLATYRLTPESVSADPASLARATQKVYRRALARGNLSRRERGIARRELRLQRAVERVGTSGLSVGTIVLGLPLFAVVALEHPTRLRAYARMIKRGELGSPHFVSASAAQRTGARRPS